MKILFTCFFLYVFFSLPKNTSLANPPLARGCWEQEGQRDIKNLNAATQKVPGDDSCGSIAAQAAEWVVRKWGCLSDASASAACPATLRSKTAHWQLLRKVAFCRLLLIALCVTPSFVPSHLWHGNNRCAITLTAGVNLEREVLQGEWNMRQLVVTTSCRLRLLFPHAEYPFAGTRKPPFAVGSPTISTLYDFTDAKWWPSNPCLFDSRWA